jgi:phosphopantothenoylcysteine synthetase/decarboxylase
MDNTEQQQEQQLTAVQRAKRKYYLKNKDKLQLLKTEWNRNAYHNNEKYREMAKACSKKYYHEHRDEIRAKAKAKKQTIMV